MPLSDAQIELLVRHYANQMARFEEVSKSIEARIRRLLRSEAVRVMLSSRAKHPEDLRGKLSKNRDDARYVLEALQESIDRVVTDVSGCRIVVYHPDDETRVHRIVKRHFELAGTENAEEVHRKDDGYRATHVLVQVSQEEERESLRGSICEIQITSIASHIFNELGHDIGYKDHDHPMTSIDQKNLGVLEDSVRVVDQLSGRLLDDRAAYLRSELRTLEDAEQLRHFLEQEAARPLSGDFVRLYRMLEAVLPEVSGARVRRLGDVTELIVKGRLAVGSDEDPSDVTAFALGLMSDFAQEFVGLVGQWPGRPSALRRAILGYNPHTGVRDDTPETA